MTRPPSGAPPPESVRLGGRPLALRPLAEEIADRYFAEYPDDLERYGAAARPWEIHDTLYCLEWAVLDVERLDDLDREIAWLAEVLSARGFPVERLARNLELAADVVAERVGAPEVVARLRTVASSTRLG